MAFGRGIRNARQSILTFAIYSQCDVLAKDAKHLAISIRSLYDACMTINRRKQARSISITPEYDAELSAIADELGMSFSAFVMAAVAEYKTTQPVKDAIAALDRKRDAAAAQRQAARQPPRLY